MGRRKRQGRRPIRKARKPLKNVDGLEANQLRERSGCAGDKWEGEPGGRKLQEKVQNEQKGTGGWLQVKAGGTEHKSRETRGSRDQLGGGRLIAHNPLIGG